MYKKWSQGGIIGMTIVLMVLAISASRTADDWGFYAHRKINELAVFTLPVEMLYLYKSNIEYIEEHAVDPDKRRYASVFEGIRHYIDLDQWEKQLPIDSLPFDWSKALLQHSSIYTISGNDTMYLKKPEYIDWTVQEHLLLLNGDQLRLDSLLRLFRQFVLPQYYESEWLVDRDTFQKYTGIRAQEDKIFFYDHFSEHGVLPYHLEHMQARLSRAFLNKDIALILRLSAEIGHYIGDAHVPLHTSKNYNGQLTDQVGIHAFWESRIPELFAEEEYDFFVGKAAYKNDKPEFFWDMVIKSHQLVDSVLGIEKRLRKQFQDSRQMCFDERLGRTVLTQCEEFARAYQKAMDGMVEERMRASIHAVGSSWYTAWVDAGQPDLRSEMALEINDTTNLGFQEKETQRIKKRPHNN